MSVDISAKGDHQPSDCGGGQQGISRTEMVAVADQIDQLGMVFAEMQRQLLGLTALIRTLADVRSGEVVAMAEQSVLRAGLPMRKDDMQGQAAPESALFDAEPFAAPVHAEETIATVGAPSTPSLADVFSDPMQVDHLQEIVQSYRDLIAQPVKNEINRWIAQAGGLSCEVVDDDRFHLPGGDSKGLLALMPLAGQSAIILPAGRLVVDFTSNFANVIAMRAVTRHAFDLIGGGGGKMQLIEPAHATFIGDEWRLDRPGKIGGFSSD